MEQNYRVRVATSRDVETIFHFISHLEERSFDFKNFKDRYTENLDNAAVLYLAAVNEEDAAIGFISCQGQNVLHHEGKAFEIQELYVARNYRGSGIGKTLLAALEENLADMGCEILEVTVNAKGTDAKRFYAKMGFQQTQLKFVKEL